MKRIAILGGDGFFGWPTSLRLSLGNTVEIVDNLERRSTDLTNISGSLFKLSSPTQRIASWESLTGRSIGFQCFDISNFDAFRSWFDSFRPSVVIHFAEQRSAPFSMLSHEHRSRTLLGNLAGTLNILECIANATTPCHLIHIGSMGVYGYHSSQELREGYDENGDLLAFHPGSIYHLSKVFDHQLFQFYREMDRLTITDVHQGIIWGSQTKETTSSEELLNRYDYDGEYGTVLNRFLAQAHERHPLTLYGTGTQKRTFIHLEDAVTVIERLAIGASPPSGKVQVLNSFTEAKTLREIAEMVAPLTATAIQNLPNPRIEKEGNELRAQSSNPKIIADPIVISKESLVRELDLISRFSGEFDLARVESRARWKR
jgi:UDP-sulfoquinovose synthase